MNISRTLTFAQCMNKIKKAKSETTKRKYRKLLSKCKITSASLYV